MENRLNVCDTVEPEIQFEKKDNRKFISYFKSKSEKEVWDKFRGGSKQAFIFIYQEYFQILFNYVFQFTKDRAQIKDRLQELFFDIYKKRDSPNSTDSIKFYLYRSLRRRISKSLQSKITSIFSNGQEQKYEFKVDISVENILIKEEDDLLWKTKLERGMNRLPSRQKEALYYYFYENFSYKEIATIMGTGKVKSARTLIYRGIDSLKIIQN